MSLASPARSLEAQVEPLPAHADDDEPDPAPGVRQRVYGGEVGLGTRIAEPSRRSANVVRRGTPAHLSEAWREARTRCPGLSRLQGKTYWQLLGAGTGAPGQGESWPTTGPAPWKGPEPFARNGKSPKLRGMRGNPGMRVIGKIYVPTGARYCPAISPFAAGVVPCRILTVISRITGRKLPIAGGSKVNFCSKGVGNAVPRSRCVSTPVQGLTSIAYTSTGRVGSVVKPTTLTIRVKSTAIPGNVGPAPTPSSETSWVTYAGSVPGAVEIPTHELMWLADT